MDRTAQPPPLYSSPLEVDILGALLIDASAMADVVEWLRPEHFWHLGHRVLFAHMRKCWERVRSFDSSMLRESMAHTREFCGNTGFASDLDAIGGVPYLIGLPDFVVTSIFVDEHAKKLVHLATHRGLREAGQLIAHMASDYDPDGDAAATYAKAVEILEMAAPSALRAHQNLSFRQIVDQQYERILIKSAGGIQSGSVFTNIPVLDTAINGGFDPGQLIVLGGRPAMGKSAMALAIAADAAITDGVSVDFFTLEMPKEQVIVRLACRLAKIPLHVFKNGALSSHEVGRLQDAGDQLEASSLRIYDDVNITPASIESIARRNKSQFVVIDYLQLMSGSSNRFGRDDNRVQEISKISRGLKTMAISLNVPVLALAQLSRSVESRPDKRPILPDLRESGSIEQDADIVAFVYRDEYYDKSTKNPGVTEIIIAKQRDGTTGTVETRFNAAMMTFG